MRKEPRLLRLGFLGCGPIPQFAHFEPCRKARNAELYAICDVAGDLVERMAAVHAPQVTYTDYKAMLSDPNVEAVIIAVADQFHVPAAREAIEAGKHVLVEKPMGVDVEECEDLRETVLASGLVLQVGTEKRFDPGIAFAHRFIREQMGEMLALKAWYCDSLYRYAMTDTLQPIPLTNGKARRPEGDPKADRRRYYLMAHGSHLLDLTIAVRMDWHEGFQVYGEYGSVIGKTYNPWYLKSSDVECFSTTDGQYHRPLGEDAHFFRLQVEGFADRILHGIPTSGADVDDGLAAVRGIVSLARASESGAKVLLSEAEGGV